MSDFIYDRNAMVRAFRVGDFLYDMQGRAIGRVSAERVYRFDGSYVGEMFRNMVVEKPVGARRDLPPIRRPPDMAPPPPDTARGGGECGFPDIFGRLLENPDG